MRANRVYTSAISTKWLDTPEKEAKFASTSVDALKTALGATADKPQAVLFDPDVGKMFVSELYLAASPDVRAKIDEIVAPFTGSEAAAAYEAAKPEGLAPLRAQDPAKAIAVDDEVVLTVPKYAVENGQVVLDKDGQPVPQSQGFTALVRDKHAGVVQFKRHVFNPDTEEMGTWVARASEIKGNKEYADFLKPFMGPDAAAAHKIAATYEGSAKDSVRKARDGLVIIEYRDVCTSTDRTNLQTRWRAMEPQKYVGAYFALQSLHDRTKNTLDHAEAAAQRYKDGIAASVQGRSRKVDGSPRFTDDELVKIGQRERELGLTTPDARPLSDQSKEGRASRDPAKAGLRSQIKHIELAQDLLAKTYELQAFPIPTLAEAVADYNRSRGAARSGQQTGPNRAAGAEQVL